VDTRQKHAVYIELEKRFATKISQKPGMWTSHCKEFLSKM